MKPNQLRAARRAARDAQERRQREEALDASLRGMVAGHLLPTAEDRDQALRDARDAAQIAVQCPPASRQMRALELRARLEQLIYCERVLALDSLQRCAGVTQPQASQMRTVTRRDLEARAERLYAELTLVQR